MKNNLDEKLKHILGTTQKLDTNKFSARVMEKLREEKQKEERHPFFWRVLSSIYSSLFLKPHYLIRLSYASVIVIVFIFSIVLFIHKGKKEHPISITLNGKKQSDSVQTSKNIDNILLSTDADTILLTGEYHLISDDPLLRPHSIWDQQSLNITLSLYNS